MPPLPLAAVPDRRRETKDARRAPADPATIAACGIVAGAESREDIAGFGTAEESFLRRYLPPAGGVPGPDRSSGRSLRSTRPPVSNP